MNKQDIILNYSVMLEPKQGMNRAERRELASRLARGGGAKKRCKRKGGR